MIYTVTVIGEGKQQHSLVQSASPDEKMWLTPTSHQGSFTATSLWSLLCCAGVNAHHLIMVVMNPTPMSHRTGVLPAAAMRLAGRATGYDGTACCVMSAEEPDP